MPTNTILRDTMNIQRSAADKLGAAKARFRKISLRNALSIGKQIIKLRKDSHVSRAQMVGVLGVANNSLYYAEHPDKSPLGIVQPETQLRYLNAVKTFCAGVTKAAENTKFERSPRGRPRRA